MVEKRHELFDHYGLPSPFHFAQAEEPLDLSEREVDLDVVASIQQELQSLAEKLEAVLNAEGPLPLSFVEYGDLGTQFIHLYGLFLNRYELQFKASNPFQSFRLIPLPLGKGKEVVLGDFRTLPRGVSAEEIHRLFDASRKSDCGLLQNQFFKILHSGQLDEYLKNSQVALLSKFLMWALSVFGDSKIALSLDHLKVFADSFSEKVGSSKALTRILNLLLANAKKFGFKSCKIEHKLTPSKKEIFYAFNEVSYSEESVSGNFLREDFFRNFLQVQRTQFTRFHEAATDHEFFEKFSGVLLSLTHSVGSLPQLIPPGPVDLQPLYESFQSLASLMGTLHQHLMHRPVFEASGVWPQPIDSNPFRLPSTHSFALPGSLMFFPVDEASHLDQFFKNASPGVLTRMFKKRVLSELGGIDSLVTHSPVNLDDSVVGDLTFREFFHRAIEGMLLTADHYMITSVGFILKYLFVNAGGKRFLDQDISTYFIRYIEALSTVGIHSQDVGNQKYCFWPSDDSTFVYTDHSMGFELYPFVERRLALPIHTIPGSPEDEDSAGDDEFALVEMLQAFSLEQGPCEDLHCGGPPPFPRVSLSLGHPATEALEALGTTIEFNPDDQGGVPVSLVRVSVGGVKVLLHASSLEVVE